MKRAKYSVEIRANVFDEVGSVAGSLETGEKDSMAATGGHGGAVLDLQRELKAAYQRWLDASDEELTSACERAMGKAAKAYDLRTEKLIRQANGEAGNADQ